jgi:hypothetical protein
VSVTIGEGPAVVGGADVLMGTGATLQALMISEAMSKRTAQLAVQEARRGNPLPNIVLPYFQECFVKPIVERRKQK